MSDARSVSLPARNHPVVSRIVARWRGLTANSEGDRGRRTLVACSGGADSSALALALAAASRDVVVAHIVHDMRPADVARTDRDAAAALAEALQLRFVEAHVARNAGENAEASYRRSRYAALERLAREANCDFMATAHQADDQLETVLMRLARGAGPRGLAGVASKRRLESGIVLIRPMLNVTGHEARSLCRKCGWTWQEDASNNDVRLARARLRATVMPELARLFPAVAAHAAATAREQGLIAGLIVRAAARRIPEVITHMGLEIGLSWPRDRLRRTPVVILGEVIRSAAGRLAAGRGMDRYGRSQIDPVVRAIRGAGTDPRLFVWSVVEVEVTAHEVRMSRLEEVP